MTSQYYVEFGKITAALEELDGSPFYRDPFIHDIGIGKLAWQAYTAQIFPKARKTRDSTRIDLERRGELVGNEEEGLRQVNDLCIKRKIYPYEFDRDTQKWMIASVEEFETHVNQGIFRTYRALEGRINYAVEFGKPLISGMMPTILLEPLKMIKDVIDA